MQIDVADDAADRAGRWIGRRVRDAVRRRGAATLALSGGSTAPPMIAALVESDVPWGSVGVWQVDERIAPDAHRARNANQLAVLDSLPCRVRRMPVTAQDLRAAARRYAATLPERFDVVHLGVGADGHTASWPPDAPEVRASERAVEIVEMFSGWPRMTLTGSVVAAARSRVVLTLGADKRDVVARWLEGDPSLPVSAVPRRDTWVFLDAAAAPPAALH